MILQKSIIQGVENHKYLVKIAESESKVKEALELRYRVFSNELNRKFEYSDKRDYDQFDDQCHHLLVIEKDSNSVIGTYRLQTYQQAASGNGFVTAKRFAMEYLPDEILKKSFELGRVCIHPDHRSGRVLFLLWKGLASYLKHFELEYLFGHSALDTDDPVVAMNTYHFMVKKNLVNKELQIPVYPEYSIDQVNSSNGVDRPDEIDIPPLFKNYLDVGTRVCSKPAYDSTLNIFHFFILLDIRTINARTRKMFFG